MPVRLEPDRSGTGRGVPADQFSRRDQCTLISFAELGFAWDGDERGWVRPSPPPLRMMTGPVQQAFLFFYFGCLALSGIW